MIDRDGKVGDTGVNRISDLKDLLELGKRRQTFLAVLLSCPLPLSLSYFDVQALDGSRNFIFSMLSIKLSGFIGVIT